MIRALIFDMDDTLIDTRQANFEAYRRACQEEGITVTYRAYATTSGLSWRDSIPRFARVKDEATVKRIHERKVRLYKETISLSKPILHTVELLKALHKRYRTALVTSASAEGARLVLRHHRLSSYFSTIITAADVKKGKPDPECFLLAAERLGVKPEECLAFEDSESGFIAAERAGMPYINMRGGKK